MDRWLFGRRMRAALEAWVQYREVAGLPEGDAPVLFTAGFSMGVGAAQRALTTEALQIEADFLDQLGEHEEAKSVRARMPKEC